MFYTTKRSPKLAQKRSLRVENSFSWGASPYPPLDDYFFLCWKPRKPPLLQSILILHPCIVIKTSLYNVISERIDTGKFLIQYTPYITCMTNLLSHVHHNDNNIR